MKQRYKLLIEYDGSKFSGWQRQANSPSIQESIENAINKFSGETVTIFGSGRTDTGVHALEQVAHFDITKNMEANKIVSAINFYLKQDKISILDCEAVDPNFHARFSAKARSYIYRIINRTTKLSIEQDKAWLIKTPLDLDRMRIAAGFLIGMHDFSSFRGKGCTALSPIKTVNKIEIYQTQNYQNNIQQNIDIYVQAPSFLYHMVRNIVGSLAMVGKGIWQPEDLQQILKMRDRTKAGPTAPAGGLYFYKVEF